MHRKALNTSNPAQGELHKNGFLCALLAVLGLHGIVVKCKAVIFFCIVDCEHVHDSEVL